MSVQPTTQLKPVMDIAPPKAGISMKTSDTLSVKEPPHDAGTDASPVISDQGMPTADPPQQTRLMAPKPVASPIAGIVAITVTVMVALASLTIVVYLKS